ncbi:MAG: hypothetical protein AB1942_12580 [Pseudomonadota bacterium]
MDFEESPNLHDLMAAVGYLLLRWGNLERQLNGASPPPELDTVRSIRNVVSHGIEEASADPTSGAEPLLRCRDRKGQLVTVTYADLLLAIRALERFRGALAS